MLHTDLDQGVGPRTPSSTRSGPTSRWSACLMWPTGAARSPTCPGSPVRSTRARRALMAWDLLPLRRGAVPIKLDAQPRPTWRFGCTYKYLNAGTQAPPHSSYVPPGAAGNRCGSRSGAGSAQSDQFAMGPGLRPGAPGIDRFGTGHAGHHRDGSCRRGGPKLLAEAGIERLREKGIALTSYLIHLADEWLEAARIQARLARRAPTPPSRQPRNPASPGCPGGISPGR